MKIQFRSRLYSLCLSENFRSFYDTVGFNYLAFSRYVCSRLIVHFMTQSVATYLAIPRYICLRLTSHFMRESVSSDLTFPRYVCARLFVHFVTELVSTNLAFSRYVCPRRFVHFMNRFQLHYVRRELHFNLSV